MYSGHAQTLHQLSRRKTKDGTIVWGAYSAAFARDLRRTDVLAVKAFTLAPPSQAHVRYRVRQHNHFREPAGGALSDHDVLVSLEGDALAVGEVRAFVDEDGRARNLDWGIADARVVVVEGGRAKAVSGRGIAKEGIEDLPCADGSSTAEAAIEVRGEKEDLQVREGPEAQEQGQQGMPAPNTDLDGEHVANAPGQLDLRVAERMHPSQLPASRFILTFSSSAEAKRFVRSWHRRTLNGPGRRRRIVNATTMW
jgi:hypothetical protein